MEQCSSLAAWARVMALPVDLRSHFMFQAIRELMFVTVLPRAHLHALSFEAASAQFGA